MRDYLDKAGLLFALVGAGLALTGILSVWIGFALLFAALAVLFYDATTVFKRLNSKTRIIIAIILVVLLAGYLRTPMKNYAKSKEEHPVTIVNITDTPLITDQRRMRITAEVRSFYGYLSGIGFKPPGETPPLAILSPEGGDYGAWGGGASPLNGNMIIETATLDDQHRLLAFYGEYAFSSIIGNESPSSRPVERQNRSHAGGVIGEYFSCSYLDSCPDDIRYKPLWVSVLWEMRTKAGAKTFDRAMFNTTRAMNNQQTNNAIYINFDRYMAWYVTIGFRSVEMNLDREMEVVNATIKSHGLPVP